MALRVGDGKKSLGGGGKREVLQAFNRYIISPMERVMGVITDNTRKIIQYLA